MSRRRPMLAIPARHADLADRLAAQAQAEGRPQSELLVEALEAYLTERQGFVPPAPKG